MQFSFVITACNPGHSLIGSVERTICMPASSEPSIRVIRLIGVVDDARHDNRRSAILDQIDPLSQSTVSFRHDVQEILNCPGNAVALGLTRNHHGIERQ